MPKKGKIPEKWLGKENTLKYAQKYTDARWVKKGDETHYGYKNVVKADADSKIVTDYVVTAASVHDSQEFLNLINNTDKKLYAGSAFKSIEIDAKLPENVENLIHEKGYRNHPLTDDQKADNKAKSKVRCRIEHIFGFMTNSMNGIFIRTIGIKRAEFQIGLSNLVYNMCRLAFLRRTKK
jgi:transposase, IS4 family